MNNVELYILMNLVFIIIFMFFRFKKLPFDLLIWIVFNIFLIPIFLLGEFWADYEMTYRAQELGFDTAEYSGGKKSVYLGCAYIAVLYSFVCHIFNLENNFFILLLFFAVYYFLNLGYFFYRLARIKTLWMFLCVFSYMVAIYCYFS